MSYLERLRNRQGGKNGTEKNRQPYRTEPAKPAKGTFAGFEGALHEGPQVFFEAPSLKQPSAHCPTCGSLQDVPQIPKSSEPRQVEAWTPSGQRMIVTAYSEEHAAAIRRMNPPPADAADRREALEERAAIMQYDGGLTMKEAEQKAGTCYYCRRWRGTRSGKGYCCIGFAPPVPRMANETCGQFAMHHPPSQRDYAPDIDDRYPF